MGLYKQLCGEQDLFRAVAAEGTKFNSAMERTACCHACGYQVELWLLLKKNFAIFPSWIGLRLSPPIGIKKALAYFTRKVYETDPLICPGWQPGVYSGRGFRAILVKGKLKCVNTLCPMNWWANSNGWR